MDRSKLKQDAKNKVDGVLAELIKLEVSADASKGALVDKYRERITALKKHREQLKDRYEKLTTATDEKFEDAEKSFKAHVSAMKEAMSDLTNLLKG